MIETGSSAPVTSLAKPKALGLSRVLKEPVIRAVCFLCAALSIVITLVILTTLLKETIAFFQSGVTLQEFFGGREWSPTFKDAKFGIQPLISGTLMITFGSALIALPLGLMSAVYLSEYASARVRNILKPVLEILAGIPTVVYGYFALFHITPLLRSFIPDVGVFNALSGCIVVGVMILPLVSSLCEDAITAVPRGLREGAYGLGSTKFEVTSKIAVPAALSGISAAFILALSRAIGETMAVTLAAGQTPNLTADPRQSIQTMTAYIVQISKGDTPAGSKAYLTIFAVGVTLFAITFGLNMIASLLVKKYRLVYQ
jgi:phosphate transport system permease protein